MAAFQFRLAPVLRYRVRIQEEKEWELSLLNQARQRVQADIDDLERRLSTSAPFSSGEMSRAFTPLELRLQADYADSLLQQIKSKRAELTQLDCEHAAKREELVEALREVKTLERLCLRLEEKFRRDQNLKEQNLTDEVGQRKFTGSGGGQKLP